MRHALIVVLVLLAIFASRAVLFFPGPPSMDWSKLIARITTDWVVWLLLAPGIVWLTRRFPLVSGRWLTSLLVHLLAAVATLGLHAFVRMRLGAHIAWMPYAPLQMLMYAQAHVNFLTYWSIVAATTGYDYYERYRAREQEALRLEAELARAQLDALTRQLQPHFLFNTMNAISAFMREDVERADRMLGQLGELLRTTLTHFDVAETPFSEELQFIERYLDIQRERFGARLEVQMAIDAQTLPALVPPLILQPLIENAIQHGNAARMAGGKLVIGARRVGERLRLTVQDDGPGLSDVVADRKGVGISNTRARLHQIYGTACHFELRNHPDGGAVATIEIPLKT